MATKKEIKQAAQAHSKAAQIFAIHKKYEAAFEEFKKSVSIYPDPHVYFMWGNILQRDLKRYEEAVEKFQKAVDLHPKDAGSYATWGSSLQKLNRYEEAIEKLKKVVEIQPADPGAYSTLADALVMIDKMEEAADLYEQAISLCSSERIKAQIYTNWGKALANKGRNEEAIERYKKAIEIKPDFREAHKKIEEISFKATLSIA